MFVRLYQNPEVKKIVIFDTFRKGAVSVDRPLRLWYFTTSPICVSYPFIRMFLRALRPCVPKQKASPARAVACFYSAKKIKNTSNNEKKKDHLFCLSTNTRGIKFFEKVSSNNSNTES